MEVFKVKQRIREDGGAGGGVGTNVNAPGRKC